MHIVLLIAAIWATWRFVALCLDHPVKIFKAVLGVATVVVLILCFINTHINPAPPAPRYHSVIELIQKAPENLKEKCAGIEKADAWFDCLGVTPREKQIIWADIESNSRNRSLFDELLN